jgi:uncharacterized membrane protein
MLYKHKISIKQKYEEELIKISTYETYVSISVDNFLRWYGLIQANTSLNLHCLY